MCESETTFLNFVNLQKRVKAPLTSEPKSLLSNRIHQEGQLSNGCYASYNIRIGMRFKGRYLCFICK